MKREGLEQQIEKLQSFHSNAPINQLGELLSQKSNKAKLWLRLVSSLKNSRYGIRVLLILSAITRLNGFQYGKASSIVTFEPTINNQNAIKNYLNFLDENGVQIEPYAGQRASALRKLNFLRGTFSKEDSEYILKTCRSSDQPFFVSELLLLALSYKFYQKNWSRSAFALIVSNDHSAEAVAIAAIARLKMAKTIYVQHAAVSKYFPPLNFDLSVLKDERSLRIYEDIAMRNKLPMPQNCFILPMASPRQRRQEGQERNAALIGLTSILSADALESLTDQVMGLDEIDKVYVKPHPRSKGVQLRMAGVEFLDRDLRLDQLPADIRFAICGNTSMISDLLAIEIPVYYCGSLDPIEDDYYGFVADGCVERWSMSDAEAITEKTHNLCQQNADLIGEEKEGLLNSSKAILQ